MTRKQRGVQEKKELKGCKQSKCRICNPSKNNDTINDNQVIYDNEGKMAETDKEYKLRCFASKLLSYFDDATNNYEALCDCFPKNATHIKDCQTTYIRHDVDNFEKELATIIKGDE